MVGDWTDNLWEGRSAKGKTKIVGHRMKTLEAEKKLDAAKTSYIESSSARDAESVFASSDEDEIAQNLRSYLDSRRAGDSAVGQDGAVMEDSALRTLAAQQSVYRTELESLRTQAIAAQGRLLGILSRARGYDSAGGNQATPKGPLILAVIVGLIEWFQTASWLFDNISLWAPTLDGIARQAVGIGGALVITVVVMTVTYIAGRKLKEGVVARRARTAEGFDSGSGGELGPGIAMALGAAVFQAVTLALRFSTETGDGEAQNAAIVVGLVGFFGAMFVLLWEYTAFVPAPSGGTAVFTRQADDATVREFKRVEYRLLVRIPEEKRDLQVDLLRRDEKSLERLQPAARSSGQVHVRVLNKMLSETRKEITQLNTKEFEYDPFDLVGAASKMANRSTGV